MSGAAAGHGQGEGTGQAWGSDAGGDRQHGSALSLLSHDGLVAQRPEGFRNSQAGQLCLRLAFMCLAISDPGNCEGTARGPVSSRYHTHRVADAGQPIRVLSMAQSQLFGAGAPSGCCVLGSDVPDGLSKPLLSGRQYNSL